jgi:hypothetical protein
VAEDVEVAGDAEVVGDAEAAGFRMAVEAFLVAEAIFREEVAVSQGAAVFLAAAAVVSPAGRAVFFVTVVAACREAAVIFPAGATAVPLDRTVFRKILRCFPISADRGRVAVECHRVQSEVNQLAVVHRREEARHSCRPAIDRTATREIGRRNFPLAMEAAQEPVQVRFHPSAQVEAMPAIFSASPPGSGPALRSLGQSRISPVNFPRIVLAEVKSPLLLTNAQIGARAP